MIAKPIPGTERAKQPFWSPDGRFVAFFADKKLKKIDVDGGPPQIVCDAPNPMGGSWNREGVIVFVSEDGGPLYRVSSAGGEPLKVSELDSARKETAHRYPYFSPDSKHFLFVIEGDQAGLYLGSLDSKETKFLTKEWQGFEFAAGHLLFFRDSILMTQAFDVRKLQLNGEPFPFETPFPKLAGFASSEQMLIVVPISSPKNQLVWYDRAGKRLASLGDPNYFGVPRISPDGKQVAVNVRDQNTDKSDIWLYDVSRNKATRFTSGYHGVWSPDGNQILYTDDVKKDLQTTARGLYRKSFISEEEELLVESKFNIFPTDWSLDGRYIAYAEYSPKTYMDQWIRPAFGDQKPFLFLKSSDRTEWMGRFSPDGRWLAYMSNDSGDFADVFVRPFPGPGAKIQVSSRGGGGARWRRDGKELFYMSENELFAVEVISSSTFTLGTERRLFSVPKSISYESYDVTADGQRFLVAVPLDERKTPPITAILNWTKTS